MITTVPATAAECSKDQYAQFSYKEPIPLGNDSLHSVISRILECEIEIPSEINVYYNDGMSFGEVKGLLGDKMIIEEIGVYSGPYWVISEARTGQQFVTPTGDVEIALNAREPFALTMKTGRLPSVKYNPATQGVEPRVVGPAVTELLPDLRNQAALAVFNASAGLGGDPLQEITFRSEPAAASLWFDDSFKGETEKRFGIARSQLNTVKMTLEGYEECNSSHYRRVDTGYNVATITCEMKKQ
ncbi:hypothetical protein [Stappia sp.]|uniref:hypothetical protein n=1 Tax=Stappia sp. TaxID=1870903 RepID=UPI003A9987D5